MSLQVRFISKRENTSTDFWWMSTNTEIQSHAAGVVAAADNLGIEHSRQISEDNLTLTSTFTVDTLKQWRDLTNQMNTQIPDMLPRRQQYFLDAGHTLVLEWFDEESQQIVGRNLKILETATIANQVYY